MENPILRRAFLRPCDGPVVYEARIVQRAGDELPYAIEVERKCDGEVSMLTEHVDLAAAQAHFSKLVAAAVDLLKDYPC